MRPMSKAQAGTLESSDIMVMVEPVEDGTGRVIELSSNVMMQYGDRIKKQIHHVLDKFEVADVRLVANDKGALDATICARVETAIRRSCSRPQEAL